MQNAKTTGLVWFRNDLRVRDQKSLSQAIAAHDRVIAVYHFPEHWLQPTQWGFKKMEGFRAAFLLQTLAQLQKDLAKLNISLWVKVGRLGALLKELQETYKVTAIYGQKEWTQEELDDNALIPAGIEKHWSYDQFLFHPNEIPMQVANVPEVFTMFRKKCEKHVSVRLALPIPSPMPEENLLMSVPELPTLSGLGYENITQDKRTAIPFKGGEQAAWERLEKYFWNTNQLSYYKKTRNGLLGKKKPQQPKILGNRTKRSHIPPVATYIKNGVGCARVVILSTSQAGLRRRARVHWRTDQPSYREPGPFGGCNFLSHKCFCIKETLEEHLAQDAPRVFL